MYTLCWSVKGGGGTTVVAGALALLSARHEPTIVIDLGGDIAPALGVAAPAGPGVGEWLAAPGATADGLARLATECAPDLRLVHPGRLPRGAELTDLHVERLAAACSALDRAVVIDAGREVPAEPLHHCAGSSLLVVRPCYLALRRATQHSAMATGIVVVHEPGRALGTTDVERALGRPVVAEVPWDPAVARAVDAGLLATRLPLSLSRPLGRPHLRSHAA